MAVTLINVPGWTPAVFSVTLPPVPEMAPAEAEYVIVTGRLSGLLALQVMVEVPPDCTLSGFAEQEIVGAFGCVGPWFGLEGVVGLSLESVVPVWIGPRHPTTIITR
jgi:hypothetical protein